MLKVATSDPTVQYRSNVKSRYTWSNSTV